MAQIGMPINGAVYAAEDAGIWFYGRTNGVFAADDVLKVTPDVGMYVNISPGGAWLTPSKFRGIAYANTEPAQLHMQMSDNLMNRIDRVVIRWNMSQIGVHPFLMMKTGTPSYNPQPPAIERSDAVWELALADIRVNAGAIAVTPQMIIDQRPNREVCGFVTDGAEQLTMGEIEDKFHELTGQLTDFINEKTDEFNTLVLKFGDVSRFDDHIHSMLFAEDGVHGLRWHNEQFEVQIGEDEWQEIGAIGAPISVTGVNLDRTSINLATTTDSNTAQLVATVLPVDATFQSVTWVSSNVDVATVDQTGLVTAVGSGVANIMVITADGGFTAIASLNVTTSPYVWYAGNTPSDSSWQDVCYSDDLDLFCAVASTHPTNGFRVMTSPDGLTWTGRVAANLSVAWQTVAYGAGKFVALGGSGTAVRGMYSIDGINWILIPSLPVVAAWSKVRYSKRLNLFVAISQTDVAMYSSDGLNWTQSASASNVTWQGLTDSEFGMVASSSYTNAAAHNFQQSQNGINWGLRAGLNATAHYGITYGKGLYVAVGSSATESTKTIVTSPDGLTWTARDNPPSGGSYFRTIEYGDGIFVAVRRYASGAPASTLAAISTDGINWIDSFTAAVNEWVACCYGNGRFVAVSTSGTGNRAMVMQKMK